MSSRVKYNQNLDLKFAEELKLEVKKIIRSKSPFYDLLKTVNILRGIALFSIYWYVWYLLAFHKWNLVPTIGLIVLFGIVSIILGFTTGHDAGHGSFTKNNTINRMVFWVVHNMIGLSSYIWKQTHNLIHHPYVNMPNHDIDVQENPVFRLGPHCKHKKHHRYQHFLAPILYSLFFFNKFFFNDFRCFKVLEKKYFNNRKHQSWRMFELVTVKLLYIFYMIVIPIIFSGHSAGQVLVTYYVFIGSVSIIFAFTLGGSHISTKTKFNLTKEDGSLNKSFYYHQLSSTVDFYPESHLCSFVFGGLNSHVAHHLYPHLNSVYYPAVTTAIKKLAIKHHLPYNELSIKNLCVEHYRFIRKLGLNIPEVNKQLVKP